MMPRLVLIGGFLGSGKTTWLLAAAARLHQKGRRVALILNDQAGELVDTRLARAAGFEAGEVAGGCFCCRFTEFLACAEELKKADPEVLLAEPVGSCADISATVLRPMQQLYGNRFQIAPFTVLVDAARARELTDPLLSYLFQKQLQEADIVLASKSDLGAPLDGIDALPVSALTGQGLDAWLDTVLANTAPSAARLLDIDYRLYAEAEAALGWLNWHAELRTARPLTPARVAGPFLDQFDRLLTAAQADIAHLKIFVQASTGYIKASLCRNGQAPAVQGDLDAPPARVHEIVLNLRAKAEPAQLRQALDTAAAVLPGRATVRYNDCFRPAPPQPVYRFQENS